MGRLIGSTSKFSMEDLSRCTSMYNFPDTAIVTATERDFLHLHTPAAVLGMIKDGSYDSKLAAFLNTGDPPSDLRSGFALRELFEKELTQSDVGKRKGLVIPRKDAEEYFPDVKKWEGESMGLRFVYRKTMRWLELKYCFYQSSQSYVLTTGWCKFVKDGGLKEKDVIKFYELAKRDGEREERYVVIDIVRRCEKKTEVKVLRRREKASRVREEVVVVRKRRHWSCDMERGGEKFGRIEVSEIDRANCAEKGVKLFGVVIG